MFNNINVQIKRMLNRFSAYGRPINVCLSQGFQLSPQYFIFRKGTIRVLIDNGLGYFTDILQKLSVAGYIRYFQIEGDAALLGSLPVPTAKTRGERTLASIYGL